MDYDGFLAAVGNHGGPTDREHADAASKAILAGLGQRLAGGEPRDLASQLPVELQHPLIQHTGSAENTDDVQEFLTRIAERESYGCTREQAHTHAQAVLGTLASFVSRGELDDLRRQLPSGYAELFTLPQ